MKKIFTITCLFVLALALNAQVAYVGNPSFEELDGSYNTGAKGWTLVLSNNAQATASITTTDVKEGTNAIQVVITSQGDNYGTPEVPLYNDNIKLVSDNIDFSGNYEIVGLAAGTNFKMFGDVYVKHSNANAADIAWRHVVTTNGVDLPKSNGKVVANDNVWNLLSLDATRHLLKKFPYATSGMTMRCEIQMGKNVSGTFLLDDVYSAVDGATAKVPTALKNIENSFLKITAIGSEIIVNNASNNEGNMVVFDLTGRTVAQQSIASGENRINLAKSGIFIVKTVVNGNVATQKVAVQ
ncbi:T9SS type A sorting domain-containing protein [Labilibacter sediminis]|nr:T9SS type A sorting domain-containing protein [Labilibacter sediminis]